MLQHTMGGAAVPPPAQLYQPRGGGGPPPVRPGPLAYANGGFPRHDRFNGGYNQAPPPVQHTQPAYGARPGSGGGCGL